MSSILISKQYTLRCSRTDESNTATDWNGSLTAGHDLFATVVFRPNGRSFKDYYTLTSDKNAIVIYCDKNENTEE